MAGVKMVERACVLSKSRGAAVGQQKIPRLTSVGQKTDRRELRPERRTWCRPTRMWLEEEGAEFAGGLRELARE